MWKWWTITISMGMVSDHHFNSHRNGGPSLYTLIWCSATISISTEMVDHHHTNGYGDGLPFPHPDMKSDNHSHGSGNGGPSPYALVWCLTTILMDVGMVNHHHMHWYGV